MALFGSDKKKSSPASMPAAAPQDQINLIGKGTVFEGSLQAESDVRASGRLVGTLEVKGKAIVTETGVVDGEMQAANASIAGTVDGEIVVEELLVLKSTARVEGTIHTGRLVVEEGATFIGECTMGDGRQASGTGTGSPTSSGQKASGKNPEEGPSEKKNAAGKSGASRTSDGDRKNASSSKG
jgi:cytoskeletal protein CcmA (bactofilin family)